MRNNNLNDSFQSPSNPFENQDNFDFQGGIEFNNQPQNGQNKRPPNNNRPRGRNMSSNQHNGNSIGSNSGHRLKEPVSLNEILLAPISALYAFTIKIHSGFRLDEEVKVLVSTQTAYLVMGFITGSKVYLIMSLGNILAIIIVLMLASSYINLPDYLSPDGIFNKRNRNEEYEEAIRNYNQNMGNSTNYDSNLNQNYNMGSTRDQNINRNINQNMGKNNTTQVDPNYNDNYIRENNNPNMGNNMYNRLNNDTQSFNNFGLNTIDRIDDGVNFGISNLSENSTNIKSTKEFNSNKFDESPDDMVDFERIMSNPNQGTFSPTSNNPFKNPNRTRDQIFEENPYKNRIINGENKQATFNNMIPSENREYRRNPVHKATNNILEMVKDGFATSLSNSSMYRQDEEEFTYAD